MYIYLTMTVGSRAGVSFLLDPTEENRIGRDPECTVALGDPLCSRVHAVVVVAQPQRDRVGLAAQSRAPPSAMAMANLAVEECVPNCAPPRPRAMQE